MGHACWVAMSMPPVLTSTAEDMTFLVVLHMMCMGELCIVHCVAMFGGVVAEDVPGNDAGMCFW